MNFYIFPLLAIQLKNLLFFSKICHKFISKSHRRGKNPPFELPSQKFEISFETSFYSSYYSSSSGDEATHLQKYWRATIGRVWGWPFHRGHATESPILPSIYEKSESSLSVRLIKPAHPRSKAWARREFDDFRWSGGKADRIASYGPLPRKEPLPPPL